MAKKLDLRVGASGAFTCRGIITEDQYVIKGAIYDKKYNPHIKSDVYVIVQRTGSRLFLSSKQILKFKEND